MLSKSVFHCYCKHPRIARSLNIHIRIAHHRGFFGFHSQLSENDLGPRWIGLLRFEAIAAVMAGKIYVSPKFSEKLIFRAIQSADSATTSPVDLLSDRELEVLHLIGKGHSSISIAKQLHRSVKTIETHRAHIKEKLGCRDSEEMVRFAIDWVAQQD